MKITNAQFCGGCISIANIKMRDTNNCKNAQRALHFANNLSIKYEFPAKNGMDGRYPMHNRLAGSLVGLAAAGISIATAIN